MICKLIYKLPLSFSLIILSILFFNWCYFTYDRSDTIPPLKSLYFNTDYCNFNHIESLLSYSIIHTSSMHFYSNIMFISLNLIYLEIYDSALSILVIIITSSISACLMFYSMDENKLLVGSSGIAYGLAGASLTKFIFSKTRNHSDTVDNNNDNSDDNNSDNDILNNTTYILFILNIFSTIGLFLETKKHISQSAHAGGIINGLLLSTLLLKLNKINTVHKSIFLIIYLLYLFYLLYYYSVHNNNCSNKSYVILY